MSPSMEFLTRKCPKCGGDNIRDLEKLTGTGWGITAAGIVLILLAALLLMSVVIIWLPIMVFMGGIGLVGYARREHIYQSNLCRSCGATGTFDLVKAVQELPPKS